MTMAKAATPSAQPASPSMKIGLRPFTSLRRPHRGLKMTHMIEEPVMIRPPCSSLRPS